MIPHLKTVRRSLLLKFVGAFGPIPRPAKWVFVVGCSNSGTTLLHNLLVAHPAVARLPAEGQFLTDQLPLARALGVDRLWALDQRFRLTEESRRPDPRALKRQWGHFFNDAMRPVFVEKSPPNTVRTRWLQAHFVPACFVAIVRDGYAVAEGIARKTGHSLEAAIRQWARVNEILLADWPFLERKILISYEDLTAAPAAVLREVLGFLGLDARAMNMDMLSGGTFRVHGRTERIRNFNAESWATLGDKDLQLCERNAEQMLRQLGYLREVQRTDHNRGITARN